MKHSGVWWGRLPELERNRAEFVIIQIEMGRPSPIGVSAQVSVCIAVLILTSGCGGGGSSATQSTTVPTRAQFIRQVGALCPDNHHLSASQKALTQAIKTNDLKKASAVVASIESAAGSFYRKFERLIPPKEDRVAFLRYLSLTHQYLGINARLAAALRNHVVVEVHRFDGFAQPVADRRTASAVALGLGRCA